MTARDDDHHLLAEQRYDMETLVRFLSFKRILGDLLEMRPHHLTKFGEVCIRSLAVKQWSAELVFEHLDRAC